MIEYVSFGLLLPTGSYGTWTQLPILGSGGLNELVIDQDGTELSGLSGYNSTEWADIRLMINDRHIITISTACLTNLGHLLGLAIPLERGDRIRIWTTTADTNMYVSAMIQLRSRR